MNKFLTDLPLKQGLESNKDKNCIDLTSTVNMDLVLTYYDNSYTFKILKYNSPKANINSKNT